ncbi:MAG TPA: hypothetical protein VIM11_21655 [Tepidisphaeraceae bacterium]|jgi:hypothetical protein
MIDGRECRFRFAKVVLAGLLIASCCHAAVQAGSTSAPSTSVLSRPDFFPIGVWLQNPANAARYKAIGINIYVGLYGGPTAVQLNALRTAGMYVICDQNTAGLVRKEQGAIVGWLHGDEPDNAQAIKGGGYGPPIPAEKVVEHFEKLKQADPVHPVLLNLGQGVAWDGWYGRGVRTNHPEDYRAYLKACDIACFDIYPATHDAPAVAGNLWYVAQGVKRLVEWTDGTKPVWCCIEAAGNEKVTPTRSQIRTEVWMAITSGASGIIYFCHQFKPKFVEAALLADADLTAGVKEIDAGIMRLAPVLNLPTVAGVIQARPSDPNIPINTLCKRQGDATYIFAVAMRNQPVEVSFDIAGSAQSARVEVLDEARELQAVDGKFVDQFKGYAVHLYKITSRQ